MRDPVSKKFTVDGLIYSLTMYPNYSVDIRLIGGKFSDGDTVVFYEDGFNWNASPYGSKHNTKNPLKTIKRFAQEVLQMVYELRPNMFYFEACEENRRRVYKKLLERLKPNGYKLVCNDDSLFMLMKGE